MSDFTKYKGISEADLIETLKQSAIARQPEGVIRVMLIDNSPSPNPSCEFELIMGESVGDPTASGSE